jgi:peptidyl-prolyl cis-trans isomerase SurA
MTRTSFSGIILFIVTFFIGCGTSNPTLATIGDEKITLHSFEDNYAKNNGGWDSCAASSLEDRQKFLDLIVKYKLKVKEARAQGLEADSAVMNEIDSYHVAVAQSYMMEKELVEPGVRQLYDRKKEEIRASHILFRLKPNPTPDDTMMAYLRAMNTIDQIPTVPFDSLAVRYSEDRSVKSNYGDVGFFSGGHMVPEFEDACYSLKSGEYTKKPVRTQYGYHVIKVTVRQPNSGSVRISHILRRFNESQSDSVAVRDTIWMIYNKLKKGENFNTLVHQYSQDPGSVEKDGDIGFLERERLPESIADVFFKLKVDSITEPMGFKYGWQIFKLTDKKGMPSFADMQKDLKIQFKQLRYPYEYRNYVNKLISQYHVRIDSAAVRKMIPMLDTVKIPSLEKLKDTLLVSILDTALIHCTGNPLKAKDFADKFVTSNDFKGVRLTPVNVWAVVTKMEDAVALEQHARLAAARYTELAQLLKEYEEGTLLYRIEQDEVWKKVLVNDSLLREYYNIHKETYRWPERVNFAEIYVTTDSIAQAIYKKVKGGKNFLDVAQESTARMGYKEKKGVWGFQPLTANELSRKASTMAVDSVSAPFKYQSGWSILKVLATDTAHVKSFEDAMPEVSSGYQEEASKKREQEWVEVLRKKYPVTVNMEALSEAFKRKRIESQ